MFQRKLAPYPRAQTPSKYRQYVVWEKCAPEFLGACADGSQRYSVHKGRRKEAKQGG